MVFILVVQAGSSKGGMKLYYFTTSANTTADASPLEGAADAIASPQPQPS